MSDENRVKSQEILKGCIEKGRHYRFLDTFNENWKVCNRGIEWEFGSDGDSIEISYHELFSKDSGIMEFVRWKDNYSDEVLCYVGFNSHKRYLEYVDYVSSLWEREPERYVHLMIMGPMTAEEKLQYFLNNAVLPQ